MILSRTARVVPCASRKSSCDRAQSRGMNEFPCFGVGKVDLSGVADRFLAPLARHDDFALLILAVGQIAADQNLLRSGRDVWQPLGIHGRHFHAAELDVQIAQPRLSDFVKPFERDRLRRLFAADRPNRSAADRRDSAHHGRFADIADRDAVERPIRFLVGFLFRDHFREPFDERCRIAVAGGQDPVADVNNLGASGRFSQHRRKRLIEIGPTQRNAVVEEITGLRDVFRRRRKRFRRGPCRRHVAGGKHESVSFAQRRQHRADELGLLLPHFRVHRTGCVAQQHDFERIAVGQHFALPIPAGDGGVSCTSK